MIPKPLHSRRKNAYVPCRGKDSSKAHTFLEENAKWNLK
jgi:hypothetical protein